MMYVVSRREEKVLSHTEVDFLSFCAKKLTLSEDEALIILEIVTSIEMISGLWGGAATVIAESVFKAKWKEISIQEVLKISIRKAI